MKPVSDNAYFWWVPDTNNKQLHAVQFHLTASLPYSWEFFNMASDLASSWNTHFTYPKRMQDTEESGGESEVRLSPGEAAS